MDVDFEQANRTLGSENCLVLLQSIKVSKVKRLLFIVFLLLFFT